MAIESFFPGRGGAICATAEEEEKLILVQGLPCSGKTSLLFQFAYNAALDGHGFVLFICRRRNIQTNPPFLSQEIDLSSDALKRIHMKYVEDDEGLNKFFAAFHLHRDDAFPSAVIVDDFADFFDERRCKERYGNNSRGKEMAMVRTLALCHDAITHAKKAVKVVVSDTHHLGGSLRFLFIYKRWASSVFTITADGFGSFTLESTNNGSSSGNIQIAKYSIALHSLVLHGITHL